MTVQYSFEFSQSWLFQLANAFLFLSYVSPSILALRILLASAGLCFILWGWLILPFSLDTVLWNGCFVCINVAQTLRILWSMRPVTWDADRAKIFNSFFSGEGGTNLLPPAEFKALTEETVFQLPLNAEGNISRGQSFSRNDSLAAPSRPSSASFGSSLSPRVPSTVPTKLCQVKTYRKDDLVAALGERANTLSIILEGRCVVEALRDPAADGSADKQAWRPVAVLNEMGFTDSPEWTSRRSSRRPVYSVQIRVDSPTCRIFTWDARALDMFLRTRPEHTGAVLMSVVGLDLARKVFSANIDQKELEDELYHAPLMQDAAAALSPNGTTATRATASKARLFHLLTPEVGVNAAAEVAAAITANKRTAADNANGAHVIGMNGVSSSHVATPPSNSVERSSPHVLSIELATHAPSQALSPVPSASPVSPMVGDALYPAASPADQNRALASLLYYTRVTPKITPSAPAVLGAQHGDDDGVDAVSFHLDEEQA